MMASANGHRKDAGVGGGEEHVAAARGAVKTCLMDSNNKGAGVKTKQ